MQFILIRHHFRLFKLPEDGFTMMNVSAIPSGLSDKSIWEKLHPKTLRMGGNWRCDKSDVLSVPF